MFLDKFIFVRRVNLEGKVGDVLTIKGNIVRHSLEILDAESGEKLEKVNFGSTFYGTDKIVPVVLYNNGPDAVNFIAVLEEGAEGEEAVSMTEFSVYQKWFKKTPGYNDSLFPRHRFAQCV